MPNTLADVVYRHCLYKIDSSLILLLSTDHSSQYQDQEQEIDTRPSKKTPSSIGLDQASFFIHREVARFFITMSRAWKHLFERGVALFPAHPTSNRSRPRSATEQIELNDLDTQKSCTVSSKPRQKRHIDISDHLAALGSFLCLVVAYMTIYPHTPIPWTLGLKRQLQFIGFLLSLMTQLLSTLTPKFFVLVEATYGRSYLQNYDAILRRSFMLSNAHFFWRGILIVTLIGPMLLGAYYKEFNDGVTQKPILWSEYNYSYFGLTAPAGIQESSDHSIGLLFMSNATVPFCSAVHHEPDSISNAHGFNTLWLANGSSAKLDAPVPSYVDSLQKSLRDASKANPQAEESYLITANVIGTVTTYNDSIEQYRSSPEFWNFYLNQMSSSHANDYLVNEDGTPPNQSFQDNYLVEKLTKQDLFNRQSFTILMNDLKVRNSSWVFAAFIPTHNASSPMPRNASLASSFRENAMLFNTRRENCTGRWRVTSSSIELSDGVCSREFNLTDPRSQIMFTNSTLAMPTWYMPSLIEYLYPYSDTKRGSAWLKSTFTTVINGMYWSRAIAMNYSGPDDGLERIDDTDTSVVRSSDVYYHVRDSKVSFRPVMNPSPKLYVILAIQPALAFILLAVFACAYRMPIDGGFGMIALLAGVRVESLKFLKGASMSGELNNRLRVRFLVKESGMHDGKDEPRIEYILGDNEPHTLLPHSPQYNWITKQASKITIPGFGRRLGSKSAANDD